MGTLKHRNVLQDLVELNRPVPNLRKVVLAQPYDYEGDPIVLQKKHIANVLQRFVDGELSASDLETWADLVEGRSGIEYEASVEDELSEALFQLSTPDITGPNSLEKCRRLLQELS